MDIVWIVLSVVCFALAIIGVVYPIIPSAPAYILSLVFLALYTGFDYFGWFFYTAQGILVVLMLVIDFLTSYYGITKIGGSKAAVWGSVVGLLLGPLLIPLPLFNLLIGAFIGAIVGELIAGGRNLKKLSQIGLGSLLGFIGGVIGKFVLIFVGMILVAAALIW
ncbi:DUF456 domain-containing protein [Geomicrobium sp. JCM 19055]|uniref:DUF456 domain-containing protein n=1 Tax=Geomicrobium sp. JCM 19055 TaxID=1460649 RepID=UPI00045ECCC3|nr:DUF456 family protein [Geomicrobium sp. JCM 19055]GAJ99139.1 hypothetical protein JCM19055_2123 [Geomicrobium sp. JCM 19055]